MTLCKGYGPAFFGAFKSAEKATYAELVRDYLAKGYDYCLTATSSSQNPITCGDIVHEYRHLARPALFFKGEPPAWEALAKDEYRGADPVVIVEYRKFYSDMSGIGSSLYFGEFSGKELPEWIKFWETVEATRVPLTKHLHKPSAA